MKKITQFLTRFIGTDNFEEHKSDPMDRFNEFLIGLNLLGNKITNARDVAKGFTETVQVPATTESYLDMLEAARISNHPLLTVVNTPDGAWTVLVAYRKGLTDLNSFNVKPSALITVRSSPHPEEFEVAALWVMHRWHEQSFLHNVALPKIKAALKYKGERLKVLTPQHLPTPGFDGFLFQGKGIWDIMPLVEALDLRDELTELGIGWKYDASAPAVQTAPEPQVPAPTPAPSTSFVEAEPVSAEVAVASTKVKDKQTTVKKVVKQIVGTNPMDLFDANAFYRQVGLRLAEAGIKNVESKTAEVLGAIYEFDSEWVKRYGDFSQVAALLSEGEKLNA